MESAGNTANTFAMSWRLVVQRRRTLAEVVLAGRCCCRSGRARRWLGLAPGFAGAVSRPGNCLVRVGGCQPWSPGQPEWVPGWTRAGR